MILKTRRNRLTKFPEITGKVIFAFEIEGEEFYSLSDYTNLPPSREIPLMAVRRQMELRINREQAKKIISKVKELIMGGQPANAVAMLVQMEQRLEFLTEENIMLELAAHIFFKQEDSPEEGISPEEVKRRMQLFLKKKDQVFGGLFRKPILATWNQSALSKLDSTPSLKEQIVRKMMIESEISTLQWKILMGE